MTQDPGFEFDATAEHGTAHDLRAETPEREERERHAAQVQAQQQQQEEQLPPASAQQPRAASAKGCGVVV